MPLKLIALLFGAVLVLTRLPVVLWPAAAKKFFEKHVVKRSDKGIQALGLLSFIVALLFFSTIFGLLAVEQVVAVMFATGLLFGSMLMAMPRVARSMWKELLATHDNTLRLLAAASVLLGAAILFFLLRS